MTNKLKILDDLHRKTEINFRIETLWDFGKLEDGIDWLIEQYEKEK